MEDLILRLWVEEDHRKGDKNEAPIIEAKANMVEGKTSTHKFQKFKGKKRVAHPVTPQKYPRIFIIKIIIYSGYN